MDRDRKSTPLKELQGLIWEEGYARGDLTGDVFPDVPARARALARQRHPVGIFSSGSVLAQQSALLATRSAGDLTVWSAGISTRRSGPKGDPASYRRIGETMNVRAPRQCCSSRTSCGARRGARSRNADASVAQARERVATRRTFTRDAPRISMAWPWKEGIHDGTIVRDRARRRDVRWPTAPAVRPSQHGSVSQQIAGTKITIEYNRPVARGRELFGALVPWGHVWCPGADTCTSIELSTDVKIDGHALAAGSYSALGRADREQWTIIFNRSHARVSHALSGRSGRAPHPGDAKTAATWKR